MTAINLADAKARFSELINRIEGGEAIDIVRRGKPVARLVGVQPERKRIDANLLGKLTSGMPKQAGAAELVRAMREDERY